MPGDPALCIFRQTPFPAGSLTRRGGAGLESKPASSRWLWGKVPRSEALQTLLWRLPPKSTMRDKFSREEACFMVLKVASHQPS